MELYCGKCKSKTPTNDLRVVDYTITRTIKKSGDESVTARKAVKGLCACGTKKHLFVCNSSEIPVQVEISKTKSFEQVHEE